MATTTDARGAALPAASEPAAAMERALGDPFDPATTVSFARAMDHDEREEPPLHAFAALRDAHFAEHLVPTPAGGRMGSWESFLAMVRVVSRRDLVPAVGHGSTLLASIPVWLWGTAAQQRTLRELVTGGAFGSLAVSEDGAGSDVLSTSTRAEPTPAGYRLDGEKWLIGNGRRSAFATVFAQSEPSLSLFFVPRDELAPNTCRPLDKVRTLGLRSHDLSGIAFAGADIPRDAVIGRAGRGAEMLLMSLQFTRTMIGGLSLGAADTALRIGLRWAHERRLYGKEIFAIAPVREKLLEAYLDTLICDCTAIAAARALTVAPTRMSLWSAVTKYLVPVMCEDVVRDTSVVVSARYYLREGVADGMLQKMQRDLAIASIFEGTQLVQLALLASQLAYGAARGPARRESAFTAAQGTVELEALFAFASPAPDWDPSRTQLRLSHLGRDEIVDAWDPTAARGLGPHGDEVARLADAFVGERERGLAELGRIARGFDTAAELPGEAFTLAREHCLIHAAAACFHTWTHNRDLLGGPFADGHWLVLCLERLLHAIGSPTAVTAAAATRSGEHRGPAIEWMLEQYRENRLFSVVPLPLA